MKIYKISGFHSIMTSALLFLVICVYPPEVCYSQPQFDQTVEIPSSFNPVGSGARALGMGGAFIAVADDATAASWNPGGLIQLDLPEISYVGAYMNRTEDISFSAHPETGGSQSVFTARTNYFSAAYPFNISDFNMIVSLNYQHLYDMTREWDFQRTIQSSTLELNPITNYRQEGGLSALGLAYSIRITPSFSVGFTLNVWDDDLTENSWNQSQYEFSNGIQGNEPLQSETYSYDRYSLSGFNANFGVLWNATRKLTLGAVLKTPFNADIRHESSVRSTTYFPFDPEAGSTYTDERTEDATLSMPMSYGIGAAYRFSDAFTMSLDIYRTEWGDFEYEDANGRKTSPITSKPMDESDIDATHQVRMGAEYLFISKKYRVIIPLRGGLFYDPAPAEGSPDDYFGFTIGSGVAYKWFVFDIAYQFRFGNDVGAHFAENLGFSEDVREHTVYASVIIHF